MTRRTALITGASNGIGRATAELLSSQGYGLITVDMEDPTSLLPGETFHKANLLDPEQLDGVLGKLQGAEVDVLVNNAAIARLAPVDTLELSLLQDSFMLNAAVPLRFAQAVLPSMRAKTYGRIVNISSRALLGKEGRTAYAASKAALLGMTRTWALELAAHGITVNCVAPGPVRTAMFEKGNPPDSQQTRDLMRAIPMKRMGEPKELAHVIAFFAHENAGFTTGQVIYACGGMTVGLAPV